MHGLDGFHLAPGASATITVLDPQWNGPRLDAQVLRASGNTLLLRTASPIRNGMAVSVDISGGLILAEVEFGVHGAGGHWELHLKADQFIPSLADLETLMEAVMNEGRVRTRQ